ncbi:MAG TPA: BREX-2 system adenine-specific DNA-methyltransferase PglX, partial [Pseudomonadota bacterium]|nr:BREX-2 system adenine-specific DNA-methyltransferase PglX [Pseudomonadota bacterium]
MIDRQALLSDLKPLLKKLEDDLRERAKADVDADARLRAEWQKARDAKRTAQAFEVFRDDQITQIAVAWILSTVFVRFLEDNGLVDAPLLSGPTEPINRLQLARDRHTLYFQKQPRHSDVHYLRSVFTEVGALPGLHALFDERHNALWQLDLSPDGATLLLGFFQKPDAAGKLAHDFTDMTLGTRFLGDLYQDLSERARKQYALLQTPEFVEEFILDRTLEPAIEEFGLDKVRLIDPACGSGHFLLGAFQRLLRKWEKQEPGTAVEILTQRALDAVAGVDLNPFAVAIARFRLLCAALQACDIRRMKEARDFQINLAAGDSLLHGPRSVASGARQEMLLGEDELQHVYQTEDAPELHRILGARYHAVVGNPPYITPKDPALNKEYRERYGSCHMKYSLGVPFTERFFDLAIRGDERGDGAGYVGMITANSFMKREFGKKLIEHPAYLPGWDLTHVIDTSGAYIPGHGTPTVILFARNRSPVSAEVRMVLGIRGEPATPDDPANGLVWSAIVEQVKAPGTPSDFVSASDVPRERLAKHPWAIGGGGAAELKEQL